MLLNESLQQHLHDVRGVVHLSLQHHHQQRRHGAHVPQVEGPLLLQRLYYAQQEGLVVDHLAEHLEAAFRVGLPVPRQLKLSTYLHYLNNKNALYFTNSNSVSEPLGIPNFI